MLFVTHILLFAWVLILAALLIREYRKHKKKEVLVLLAGYIIVGASGVIALTLYWLFEIYYQPVYSIKNQSFITLEALSRLKHPTLGMTPPDVFIGIAEKQGLISAVGNLQLRRVCRFIKEHEYIMQNIRNVKFNLSPSELMKPGYSHVLIGIIQEYGLNSEYFQFEITETVATEYSESFCTAIDDFAEAGIYMRLDDFGSGYANLNAVLRIPFSAVKMDRSLLSGICSDKQAALFYHR